MAQRITPRATKTTSSYHRLPQKSPDSSRYGGGITACLLSFLAAWLIFLLAAAFMVRSLGCFGQRLVAAKIAANLRSAIAPASCKYNPSHSIAVGFRSGG